MYTERQWGAATENRNANYYIHTYILFSDSVFHLVFLA